MSDIDDEIRRLVGEYEPPTPGTQPFGRTTTDKPRLIVVVHPDIYDEAQRAVTRLGHGDVLVQSSRHVPDPSHAYVMEPPPEVIRG